MLKILHCADWHVGRTFDQFGPEVGLRLARDRVTVIERIVGLAYQFGVDAVLCAGDLFDSPDPGREWWHAVSQVVARSRARCPMILLPGNHDPYTSGSVYGTNHPFRRSLPDWVHVVDRDDFELPIGGDGVVYAAPCRSAAGERDLAMSLPERQPDDDRIRIGLVHGSTFDLEGHATNFPIGRDAPRLRGLDYLAIGDTHGFRDVVADAVAPIVYPGTPEPTSFREVDPGYVALVAFTRRGRRPRIDRERVARWTWRQATVHRLAELEALAAEDLVSSALRLELDMTISMRELDEVERLLSSLRGTAALCGRAGALSCDRSRLRTSAEGDVGIVVDDLPPTIRETVDRLREEGRENPVAQTALVILGRLLREVR